MVFTVRLRVLLGIVLLSCIQSVVNENVDMTTLTKIQKFLHFNYFTGGQFVVAINVPKEQCQSGFNPQRSNFLENDPSETVKRHTIPDVPVYIGSQLIAAGVHKNSYSESLLMNPPNDSPMTDLMNKNKDGCVIFYTFYSPCINTCLNSNHRKNIIQSLEELKAYQGIKAFVYNNIFGNDKNNRNLGTKLREIASRVPLYRCTRDGCVLCGEPGPNTAVNNQCLTN